LSNDIVGSTTLDRKRIYANISSYPNSNSSPKAQLCFRTNEMTSFFDHKCTDIVLSSKEKKLCSQKEVNNILSHIP